MPLHSQSTQVDPLEPYCSQLYLCTFDPSNPTFFNFNEHLHLQTTQIRPIQITQIRSSSVYFASSIYSNHLQYPHIYTFALNQLKSTLNCIKYAFKDYKHLMQYLHLQICTCTPIMLQTFKPPNPNDAPCAPMHLQHEAPQRLLQALESLKIHSLTN